MIHKNAEWPGQLGQGAFALASAVLLACIVLRTAGATPQTVPASPAPFGDFAQRVTAYVGLRQDMPHVKPKRQRKQIVDTRTALVRRIRETRAAARQGDIFTPVASQEFRRVILEVTRGSGSAAVMKTIAEGEPVKGWPLTINGDYPDDMPLTTLPPTLLLRLPQLPPQVAYRIIGHDFVLAGHNGPRNY